MKVIAINDAPIPKNGYYNNGVYLDKAYYKGDIFSVIGGGYLGGVSVIGYFDFLIIYHDKLGAEMEVSKDNFISLEDYRNQKIDEIIR